MLISVQRKKATDFAWGTSWEDFLAFRELNSGLNGIPQFQGAGPLTVDEVSCKGYQNVSVLEGGMAAWRQAGLAVEQGLSGVMRSPTDVVVSGPERNFADMMHYLRWETARGDKYAAN